MKQYLELQRKKLEMEEAAKRRKIDMKEAARQRQLDIEADNVKAVRINPRHTVDHPRTKQSHEHDTEIC